MMPNDWIKYATTSRREFLKKASVGLAGGQFLSKERYRSKTQEPDINATQQSISETGFIDDFEDGGFARWTPVNLPERARDISGNNWRVTSNAISGQYSLAIETIGDNDDNAIATKNQVVDLARDFSISFKWLSPDPSNRGPRLNLLSRLGSEFENERSDSIHPANGIAVGYDPDAISWRGSPYKGKADFCGNSFNRESYAADTVHTVRIEKQGGNATLFLDGQNQQVATVDRTGQYRLLLSSSGTWGNSSSIIFDEIRIRYNM